MSKNPAIFAKKIYSIANFGETWRGRLYKDLATVMFNKSRKTKPLRHFRNSKSDDNATKDEEFIQEKRKKTEKISRKSSKKTDSRSSGVKTRNGGAGKSPKKTESQLAESRQWEKLNGDYKTVQQWR